MPTHAKDLLASLPKANEGRGKEIIMKFQRGDMVEATWLHEWKMVKGPAIIIEAKSDEGWIKIWVPAQNNTMVTIAHILKHYDPK